MPTLYPNTVKGTANLHQLYWMMLSFILIGFLFNSIGLNHWAKTIPVEQSSVIRNTALTMSQAWLETATTLTLNQPRTMIDDLKQVFLSYLEKEVIVSSSPIQEIKPAEQPQVPLPVTISNSVVEQSPIKTIALVGDSLMAVSLAPNLNRELKKLGVTKVIQAYRSGTGLSRPDYFNWMTEYPKLLAGQSPKIIICTIGSNDAQGFQVGNKVYQFGQPEWSAEYARRLESFLMMLQAQNAQVYWVTLPKMRNPVFDAKIQALNKLVANRLEGQARITLISPNAILSPENPNAYIEYARDSKSGQEQLRTEDGIHLSDAGGRKLALGVIAYLKRDGIFTGQDSSK
jgi:hypothetical protein